MNNIEQLFLLFLSLFYKTFLFKFYLYLQIITITLINNVTILNKLLVFVFNILTIFQHF